MENTSQWVSILDYARLAKTSISSIRRYIKANKINHRMIEGKYYIFYQEGDILPINNESTLLQVENQRLGQEVRRLQQQVEDLKTLVIFYESSHQKPKSEHIPEIPC